MQKYLLILSIGIAAIFANVVVAHADTYVRGYTRSDGTYVAPHYRSSPNSSYNDNWSVSPNVNPHTGQQGTRQPSWNDNSSRQNPYAKPYLNSNDNSDE